MLSSGANKIFANLLLAVFRIIMQAKTYNLFSEWYNSSMPTVGRPAKLKRSQLGQLIAKARKDAGLSQQALAEKIGVTQRVIAYWERESTSLKIDQLIALSDALNTSIDYLLGRSSKQQTTVPKGKAGKIFTEVSTLPKYQQQRILSVVEDMIKARSS